MSDFGDIEPEDSWDPDDDVRELLDNVRRRLVLLRVLHADDDDERTVEELSELLETARARNDLTARDHLRIEQTADDLDVIESRI